VPLLSPPPVLRHLPPLTQHITHYCWQSKPQLLNLCCDCPVTPEPPSGPAKIQKQLKTPTLSSRRCETRASSSVSSTQKTQCICITKTNLLKPLKEIIAVYCENHMEHTESYGTHRIMWNTQNHVEHTESYGTHRIMWNTQNHMEHKKYTHF